jgi:hypothetical protein
MKKNITLCMYSHSSYSDVWDCFFSQSDKYLGDYKKVLFSDEDLGKTPDNWNFIQYSDSDSYTERVASCIEQIETELCFFHHEDMFLYKDPDYELLNKYEDIVLNEDIDFIRMLRGVDSIDNRHSHSLYYIPKSSDFLFSVQPSICKTGRLLQIYKDTPVNHIREFEINVQKTCRDLDVKGLFHYCGESKAGMYHYNSDAYPYIATAVVAGKWNTSGYNELHSILLQNNIDYRERGSV